MIQFSMLKHLYTYFTYSLLCKFSLHSRTHTGEQATRCRRPALISSPLLTMSLTSLPLLPLEKIASYLNFSSLVSLAASTSSLAHLTPKEQVVKGDDFSVSGRSYCLRRCCQIAEPSGNQGGLGMEGQSKQKKYLLLLLMNSL